MHKIFMILFFFLINASLFSQKIVKGRIIDDRNNPIIGAKIYQDIQTYGTISDLNGDFSLRVSDSVSYILILIDNLYLKELSYGEIIFERFSILHKDSLLIKLIQVQNTITKIPETTKIKSITKEKYKYELKYDFFGKLRHIYLINSELSCVDHVLEIQYNTNINSVFILDFNWNEEKKIDIYLIQLIYIMILMELLGVNVLQMNFGKIQGMIIFTLSTITVRIKFIQW